MATVGEIQAVLDADTSGFIGGISDAVGSLGDLGSLLGSTRGGILALGAAGAAVAAGGLAAATSQAIEFERTIAGAAARAGATQQAFDAFGTAAKQASLDSAFGANEAGGALRFLAQSGFEVEEATAALPGILDGATAAGLGAADMGRIASDALKAFGRSADETTDVMDVLVKGATSANTSVSQLGQGISIVGGLANKAGESIESVVSVIASMQDAGVSASRAATAMRGGIARLLKPSTEAAGALQELGVSAKDSSGNFRGMIPILSDLEEAGASNTQMLKIFGQEAGPTLQTALSQGAGALRDFQGDLENAGGTTERISNFIESSFVEQVKVLGGSLATLGANVGELVIPVLKGLAKIAQATVVGLNALVNAAKAVGGFLGGGFLVQNQKAKDATKKLGDEAKTAASEEGGLDSSARAAAAGLDEHAGAAKGAAEETKSLVGEVEDLQDELDALKRLANDADATLVEQALAEAEAAKKANELNKELQKNANQALPTMRKELERLTDKFVTSQSSLADVRDEISEVAGEDLEGVRDVPFRLVAQGVDADRLQGLLNQQARLEKQVKNTAKAQQAQQNAVLEQQSILAGRTKQEQERKKEIEGAFEQEKKVTREKRKQLKATREQIEQRADRGGQIQGGVVRQGFGAAGIRGVTQDAFDRQGAAGFRQMFEQAGQGRGQPRTQEQSPEVDVGRQIQRDEVTAEDREAKRREAMQESMGVAQDLSGEMLRLNAAMLDAAGASDSLVSGLGTVQGAISEVMGGIASGGPLGIISGAIGGVTEVFSGLARGGAGESGRARMDRSPRRRNNNRELARMIGEQVARTMKENPPVTQQITLEARAALEGVGQQESRDLLDRLSRASRLSTGRGSL